LADRRHAGGPPPVADAIPYRVYYTITAVAVVILHIRHTARIDPDLGELGH